MKKLRFTPSFFSKKSVGFIILAAAAIGLLFKTDIKTAQAAFLGFQDGCTVRTHDATAVRCPQAVGLGEACNYRYTDTVTGGVSMVSCNVSAGLVCSQNNYSPTIKVAVTTTEQANTATGKASMFCLWQAEQAGCQDDQECESGATCESGVCALDIGEGVVEGLVGEEVSDIRDTIRMFINIALGFLGVVTVIFIIYGGLIWLTAAGAEDKVTKGKNTLMWAAIGAVVISIAWTIASYVLQVGKTVGFLHQTQTVHAAPPTGDPLKPPVANGCVLDTNIVQISKPKGIGCACNYQYTHSPGGGAPSSTFTINCDEDEGLVCSRNNYINKVKDVFTATTLVENVVTQTNKTDISNVCLKKTGADCSDDSYCEGGATCESGICVLDIGAGVVEGLVGEEVSDIRDTIRIVINIALGFLGVITVIFIIYGGLIWMTAAGAEDKVTKGKNTLMWAAIGAVVISIAWTIASYVLQIGKTVG